MKFYIYVQRNTEGYYDGPHYIIVRAKDCKEANQKAEGIGVYFDGVEEGIDCPCCGDRWAEMTELDEKYGDNVKNSLEGALEEVAKEIKRNILPEVDVKVLW